ncbi:MAG: hypothetical protein ABSB66_12700 [Candidatus Acidiferrales bacterium]|jgi:hypothetical protein
MQYAIVAILNTYAEAEAAVRDLELAGIRGEQVEVITDIAADARTANTPGEPSTKQQEPPHNWLARLFGPGGPFEKREASDLSGDQPNYIGDQQFYANHLKEGGAVIMVRTKEEQPANRAAAILRDHGARTPGQKDGPTIRRIP